jgi:signal transduction histidine kinase
MHASRQARKRPRIIDLAAAEVAGEGRGASSLIALPDAESRLQVRDESLDFALALTAHELLSPVVSLKHALELLRRTGGRPELETKLLDHSLKEIDRLMELCDGVRRWSFQPEPPRLTKLDLNEAVREAAGAADLGTDRERIRLLTTDRLEVHADPTYLVDAIRNLLRVVLNSSPRTPVELQVARRARFARVEVRGEGRAPLARPPASHDAIFDPFAVEEGASVGSAARATLSLFSSRRILESHGGTIGAGPGGFGSSFFVRLPISEGRS